MSAVYHKQGRRYVQVGYDWCGFPADGIWFVKDGRQSFIAKVGDVPDPMTLAAMERWGRIAAKAMADAYDKARDESIVRTENGGWRFVSPAMQDMVSAFFKAVATAEFLATASETERGLWAAAQDDQSAWLVYGDFLEETGKMTRAEVARMASCQRSC